MTRPPVLRYGRINLAPSCACSTVEACAPLLYALRERAENAERERDAARAEVQRLTEENARLREVPAKGHATMDDLLPCVCGHSIEEHEPDCVECECLHYEADVEEDGDKEGSRG